jgi:predicted Zn finger-like uncharacterized protein
MHIVCPHCTTSYAIDPSTLGEVGRTVRCSRCKEVWLARAEDALQTEPSVARAKVAAMTAEPKPAAGLEADPGWGDLGDDDEPPVVESPPIASAMPVSEEAEAAPLALEAEPNAAADAPARSRPRPRGPSALGRLFAPMGRLLRPVQAVFSLPIACVAMAAMVAGLLIWRVDVVRLLPQTASFYRLAGQDVNLRGLAIKDVQVKSETVDNKPVLVIEGVIIGQARKPADLPRLRFVVRDDHGTEIYAWNTVLEQSVLNPGEKVWFRSRLASPPAEARSIDVRFFNRRDLASGGA